MRDPVQKKMFSLSRRQFLALSAVAAQAATMVLTAARIQANAA
jgi:hypothetical protein